jgi:hypothetical protein
MTESDADSRWGEAPPDLAWEGPPDTRRHRGQHTNWFAERALTPLTGAPRGGSRTSRPPPPRGGRRGGSPARRALAPVSPASRAGLANTAPGSPAVAPGAFGPAPASRAVWRRRGVLWRKISFGSWSARGSRYVERLLSVVATLRQQKRNVLEYLTAACRAALRGEDAPSLLPSTEAPA